MHKSEWRLINGNLLEAIPCALARARGNHTARILSQTNWLIRRKSDGRYLAAASNDRLIPLQRNAMLLAQCEDFFFFRSNFSPTLALVDLQTMLVQLGINDSYGNDHQLTLVAEPEELNYAGFDRYGRPLWLLDRAAQAWQRMQAAAKHDGIILEAISGYRGHAYQLGIFKRKLARGQTVDDILKVNAAPGYSEHHSGRAIDIGTPDEPAAEESFENTAAFSWLTANAEKFGFHLSYPRDNPHNINYEPWHWFFV